MVVITARFLVILATLLSGCALQSRAAETLARDPTKPFAYIEFDHTGASEPVEEGEPRQRLWLRLVNNSILPISVQASESATDDTMTLLPDVIIPLFRRIPRSGLSTEQMPAGYASDAGAELVIAPGGHVVFSVPVNHVSPNWYMQVPFRFSLPTVKRGTQPTCYAPFTWEDIPQNALPTKR